MRGKKIKYWWKEPLIFPESLSGALPCSLNPHAQSVWKIAAGLETVIHPESEDGETSLWAPHRAPAAVLQLSSAVHHGCLGVFFWVGFSFLIAYSFLVQFFCCCFVFVFLKSFFFLCVCVRKQKELVLGTKWKSKLFSHHCSVTMYSSYCNGNRYFQDPAKIFQGCNMTSDTCDAINNYFPSS